MGFGVPCRTYGAMLRIVEEGFTGSIILFKLPSKIQKQSTSLTMLRVVCALLRAQSMFVRSHLPCSCVLVIIYQPFR
jgi:hypothetical protein